MPAPLVLLGYVASAIGVVFREEIEGRIGRAAAQAVLDRVGVPLDLSGPVNRQAITEAICAGPLKGEVQFSNFFDRDAVKADLRRIAAERAGQAFGLESGLSIDAVRERVVSQILGELRAEVEAGAGQYISAAKDLPGLAKIVALPKPAAGWNAPRDMSAKGVANRAYQAKYRAQHTKKWEVRR